MYNLTLSWDDSWDAVPASGQAVQLDLNTDFAEHHVEMTYTTIELLTESWDSGSTAADLVYVNPKRNSSLTGANYTIPNNLPSNSYSFRINVTYSSTNGTHSDSVQLNSFDINSDSLQCKGFPTYNGVVSPSDPRYSSLHITQPYAGEVLYNVIQGSEASGPSYDIEWDFYDIINAQGQGIRNATMEFVQERDKMPGYYRSAGAFEVNASSLSIDYPYGPSTVDSSGMWFPSAVASSSKTELRGVNPSRYHLYVKGPDATWTCLDGSQKIPWSAVNDDYCDCPDGSDEPGTGACPNGMFHCKNEGHVGVDIRSSRVGDGLCELECCDGSDEAPGVCPNRCEETGKVYRAEQAAVKKLRKTGAKIRSTYVAFAKKEHKRLEEAILKLTAEVKEKQLEVDRTQDILERTESLDAASLEVKKQSPLYASLQSHNAAIRALDNRSKRYQEKIDKLEALLNDLENGFNPNYVDMAVINTVKAWKSIKGEDEDVTEPVPSGTDTAEPAVEEQTAGDEEDEGVAAEEESSDEEKEDQRWSDSEIKQLTERTDYVNLMLEYERHMQQGTQGTGDDQAKSLLYSITEYIPDEWLPTFETAKDYLVDTLATMGLVEKKLGPSADASAAREAHSQAKSALSSAEHSLKNDEEARDKLFSPTWYGKEGEWKKLDGTCLSKDTGEYTYSVCLFGSATQKSNRDGAQNNLGTFSSWSTSPSVSPGEYDYYTQQLYNNGAQCWNGPKRSVVLHLSCGTENELLSISEPEKCEYHFVGRTPALCLPLDKEEGKDELFKKSPSIFSLTARSSGPYHIFRQGKREAGSNKMLALAPSQASVIHHTASVSSRAASSSIRTSRTASPPRKPVQAHRTPTHTIIHSASVPSSSGSVASSSLAGPSVRQTVVAEAPAAPPTASNTNPASPISPQPFDVNALPQAELLRLLSQLLQRIATSNDKIYHAHSQAQQSQSETQSRHNYPVPSPDDQAYPSSPSTPLFASLTTASKASVGSPTCPLFFHARNVPTISIESYLLRILKYCPTTNEVFLSLLVYFDRMGVLAEAVTKELEGADHNVGRDGDAGKGSTMPLIIDSYNIHRLIIAGVTVASKFFSDVFYTNSRYAKVGGLPTHELNKLELQFLLLNDFRLVISAEELQRYAEQLIIYSNDPASSLPLSSSNTDISAYSSPSMELFHHQSELPNILAQRPRTFAPIAPAAVQSTSPEAMYSSLPHPFSPYTNDSFSPCSSSAASSVAPTPTSSTYDHFTPSSSTSTITQGAYGETIAASSEYLIQPVTDGGHSQIYGNGHMGMNGKEAGWESASADSESVVSNSEAGETSVEQEADEEEPTIRFIKHGLVNGVDLVETEGRNTPQRRAAHPPIPSFSGYNDDDDDDDDEEVKIITHDNRAQVTASATTMRLVNGHGATRLSLKRSVDDADDDAEATEDEIVYRGDRDSRGPSRVGIGRSGGSTASRS
ncbi:hypothetical protein FRB98_006891 [Tulasnella sp. 332]|nr:hypothetical protein FRB98_006891 [Tulasnella sp. 332]